MAACWTRLVRMLQHPGTSPRLRNDLLPVLLSGSKRETAAPKKRPRDHHEAGRGGSGSSGSSSSSSSSSSRPKRAKLPPAPPGSLRCVHRQLAALLGDYCDSFFPKNTSRSWQQLCDQQHIILRYLHLDDLGLKTAHMWRPKLLTHEALLNVWIVVFPTAQHVFIGRDCGVLVC